MPSNDDRRNQRSTPMESSRRSESTPSSSRENQRKEIHDDLQKNVDTVKKETRERLHKQEDAREGRRDGGGGRDGGGRNR